MERVNLFGITILGIPARPQETSGAAEHESASCRETRCRFIQDTTQGQPFQSEHAFVEDQSRLPFICTPLRTLQERAKMPNARGRS